MGGELRVDLLNRVGIWHQVSLSPHAVWTLTAADQKRVAKGLEGALGDGEGRWRKRVPADRPIHVMSLLESLTGYLANLSPGIDADAP